MTSTSLDISKISKRYGDFVALASSDLNVPQGEFLTLLGPSGSGKTTLLSLIAGLIQPDEGVVSIGDVDVTYSPPYERDIGMVFQNYALFPHMTVEENVAFPLRMRRLSPAETKRRVSEALEMVRLPHVAKRTPRELSGGQQQRIALARCMVYRPAIILMDEPLGALDKKLRDQMQLEIKRIHRELGTTIVYVTHDQEEAMTMSDRICLMNAGRIEQLGTPHELYFRPRTLFVADFLGESNLLPARVTGLRPDLLDVSLVAGDLPAQAMSNGSRFAEGERVKVMVRPQNLSVGSASAGGKLTGRVSEVMVSGSLTKLYIEPLAPDTPPLVAAYPTRPSADHHAIGETVSVDWHASDAVVIAEGGV
ncbi:ABC transporter ATP-binding protein [Bosea sp. LjRoot9]|uniref:ABC transporter ATP-binding protein n=1 Tax=Bosea sp. LjRoot9 TaxID=3342341 RepID=UPI003ED0D3E1